MVDFLGNQLTKDQLGDVQDDHFGAVSNCSGNVMYKAAGRSFLVNGGAGNNITVRS